MNLADDTQGSQTADVDQDGDLVLDRCHQIGKAVAIHHACSTDLSRVGLQVDPGLLDCYPIRLRNFYCHVLATVDRENSWLSRLDGMSQVWPGALLLADYILEHEAHFAGCVGMEVGAGTGFAGLVLAQMARRVFLTDHDAAVLCNCRTNVEANASMFRHGPGVALVRHLDLFHAHPSDPGNNSAGRHSVSPHADAGLAQCLSSWHHQGWNTCHPCYRCILLFSGCTDFNSIYYIIYIS